MQTNIVKWGNSQGIRLPKFLLDSINLSEKDVVEVISDNNCLVIKKAVSKPPHRTIQERLADFDGVYMPKEWDTGAPVGKEVW